MKNQKAMQQDKLQMAVEALRRDPSLLDEGSESRLAHILGFWLPSSARFWKSKACQILKQEQEAHR